MSENKEREKAFCKYIKTMSMDTRIMGTYVNTVDHFNAGYDARQGGIDELIKQLEWAVDVANYWVDNNSDRQICANLEYKYKLKIDHSHEEV